MKRFLSITTLVAVMGVVVFAISGASREQCSVPPSTAEDAAVAPSPGNSAAAPTLIAVKFHSDNCGACVALERNLAELKTNLADQSVLWLTFNLTDPNSRRQSEFLASSLRLGEVWKMYSAKTGYVLLVDAKSGEVVDRLTMNDKVEGMTQKISAAVTSLRADGETTKTGDSCCATS